MNAQSVDVDKYKRAVSFIANSIEVKNEVIKLIFDKKDRKAFKKSKEFKATLCNRVQFIDYFPFLSSIKDSSNYTGIKEKEAKDFFDKYHFESFEVKDFDNIFEKNNSKFTLAFSKIIGKTLIGEIRYFVKDANRDCDISQWGTVVKVLLIFNDDFSKIEKSYSSIVHKD